MQFRNLRIDEDRLDDAKRILTENNYDFSVSIKAITKRYTYLMVRPQDTAAIIELLNKNEIETFHILRLFDGEQFDNAEDVFIENNYLWDDYVLDVRYEIILVRANIAESTLALFERNGILAEYA